jgi:predicted dehydrogenase
MATAVANWSTMIRVGLLGASGVAAKHAAAYSKIPGIQLVAVADRVQTRAQTVAHAHGARVYAEAETLIANEALDVVDICLPPDLHQDCAIRAAERGCHVLCEKPIAPSAAEARAIIEACHRQGVILMVGHVVRFFPGFEAAKLAVAAGRVGQPQRVRIKRICPTFSPATRPWIHDPTRGGGCIVETAVHDLDFLLWCFGPIQKVFCRAAPAPSQGIDYALISLCFGNGMLGQVETVWTYPAQAPLTVQLEIAGTHGCLRMGPQDGLTISGYASDLNGSLLALAARPQDPFREEIAAFIRAVANRERPPITGEDGLAALEVALAALQSSRQGKMVELPWPGNSRRTT